MKLNIEKKLYEQIGFNEKNLRLLEVYVSEVLKFNKKYNLIGKSTEKNIWNRHVLDSAQILRLIELKDNKSLADLGTGGGFPGLVLAIMNSNNNFHVKLYEKSKVKCQFLKEIIKKLNIRCRVFDNDYQSHIIDSDYIVCRAFKKLPELLRISREKIEKPHKLIVLKGKNAQAEIDNALRVCSFKYKLISSVTDEKSKILLVYAR